MILSETFSWYNYFHISLIFDSKGLIDNESSEADVMGWFRPGDNDEKDVISVNTLRPRQNGRQIPDDNFKCIFLNENI